MGISQRFVLRLVSYLVYASLMSATLIFFLSDLSILNAISIILALFLIDRVLQLRSAKRSIKKIPIFHKALSNSDARINTANYVQPGAIRAFEIAHDKTLLLGGQFCLYLALLLVKRRDIQTAIKRLEVEPEQFRQKLEALLKKSQSYKPKEKEVDKEIKKLGIEAFRQAKKNQRKYIEPADLFAAIVSLSHPGIDRLLTLFEISEQDLQIATIFSTSRLKNLLRFSPRPKRIRHRTVNRAWTSRPTLQLDRYALDLTDVARQGRDALLIGHEEEYDRLLDVLSKPAQANALLIGEAGVGKDAVIIHLASQIIADQVPKPLFDKRIVSLEIGSLLSGAQEGELEKRLNQITQEIIIAGNIILYIPDIHNLLKGTGQANLLAADILTPIINEGNFPVIGASYPNEYKKYIEEDSAFSANFEVIRVQEMEEEEAERLLTLKSLVLESEQEVIITFASIKKATQIAHRYFRQKPLPASAEDLLLEAIADLRGRGETILKAENIILTAEKKTNIPLQATKKEEKDQLLNLEELIHEQYINQDEAVIAVSNALREYRSGLNHSDGPISTFLFTGPTGVGKTELSKILAKIQFGDKNAMTRLDMSEYQTKESIQQLIGSPDGQSGGTLTEAVKDRPYSIILLDEFEKAHPDLLNLFLQVFDDGRLTDSSGRTVSFQNTIIIATSNAHSEMIKEEIEKGAAISYIEEQLKKRLHEYFKPELINRFTKIVIFKPLSWQSLLEISKLHLDRLAITLKEKHSLSVSIEDSAVSAIATLGNDPVYGARPLERAIKENINSVLAKKILAEELGRGDSLTIRYQDKEFIFEIKKHE